MPCRVEEEGVIPGLSLGLKQGSALQKVPGEEARPDSAHHGRATKTTLSWVWELPHQTFPLQQSGRCPRPTRRKDRGKVSHRLRVVIHAHCRIMMHILTLLLLLNSPRLCNETQHATNRQPIPILIIPCPQAIYKHQWLGSARGPSAARSHKPTCRLPP